MCSGRVKRVMSQFWGKDGKSVCNKGRSTFREGVVSPLYVSEINRKSAIFQGYPAMFRAASSGKRRWLSGVGAGVGGTGLRAKSIRTAESRNSTMKTVKGTW